MVKKAKVNVFFYLALFASVFIFLGIFHESEVKESNTAQLMSKRPVEGDSMRDVSSLTERSNLIKEIITDSNPKSNSMSIQENESEDEDNKVFTKSGRYMTNGTPNDEDVEQDSQSYDDNENEDEDTEEKDNKKDDVTYNEEEEENEEKENDDTTKTSTDKEDEYNDDEDYADEEKYDLSKMFKRKEVDDSERNDKYERTAFSKSKQTDNFKALKSSKINFHIEKPVNTDQEDADTKPEDNQETFDEQTDGKKDFDEKKLIDEYKRRVEMKEVAQRSSQSPDVRVTDVKPDPTQVSPPTPIRRLPKALIIGVAYCGTTALTTFLDLHPDIVALPWESAYFCERHFREYSQEWYRMIMPPSTAHQITVEKSPCYFLEPRALERIWAFNSSIKLIITVKDPINKILSKRESMQHKMLLYTNKKDTRPIDQVILRPDGSVSEEILEWGVYNDGLENVYQLFPKHQVLIVDGEKLITDPLSELRLVENFLGVRPYFTEEDVYLDKEKGFYCYRYRSSGRGECLGTNKGRAHDVPSARALAALKDALRPYSLRFLKMVGRKLDWEL